MYLCSRKSVLIMNEEKFNRIVGRWWAVLLLAIAFAVLSFVKQWTAPFVVSAIVALVAFIAIDWMNSNDGNGSTPTIYGAC